MYDQFRAETEELKRHNLYRTLRVLENPSGVRAKLGGREVLLFCSNDYLGLTHHPRVLRAAKEAINRYGVGAGAARLISGTTKAHASLEKKLARLKGKKAALVFGSGFLANLGILTAFAGEGDVIIMDKLCHASLIDGARLSQAEFRVFPHKNYKKCEELLRQHPARRKLLVTESVFSMDGDLADLRELGRLKRQYGAFLIVDDAHGTGVLGKNGRGATEGFSKEIDVIMGTLSKSIGGLGGFAAADGLLIERLINLSRPFIFATALPPALCAAAEAAIDTIKREPRLRKTLWDNIRRVHEKITSLGFRVPKPQSAILPVMIGSEKNALEASKTLLKLGVFVPAVRYPTVPKGKARLRITVSAAHSRNDINGLLKAMRKVKGLCSENC